MLRQSHWHKQILLKHNYAINFATLYTWIYEQFEDWLANQTKTPIFTFGYTHVNIFEWQEHSPLENNNATAQH